MAMPSATQKELADFVLKESLRITQSKFGFLGFLNGDETVMHCHAWAPHVMPLCKIENLVLDFPIETSGIWGEAIRQRKSFIINDFQAPNPLKKGYPTGHINISNLLIAPIFNDNKIVAVIALANRPKDFIQQDIDKLKLIVSSAWHMIEKNKILVKLEDSKERFRIVADYTGDWEVWIRPDGSYEYISPSCFKYCINSI